MVEKRGRQHERALASHGGLEARDADFGPVLDNTWTQAHPDRHRPDVGSMNLRDRFEMDEYRQKQFGEAPRLVNEFCEENPVAAFEIATDVLTRIAESARAMNEDSGQALALMEARSERIDRMQAENRKLLDALVAGRPA